MEFFLARAFQLGRPMTRVMRNASEVRGRFAVRQVADEERRRHVLLAEFKVKTSVGQPLQQLLLFDVSLLPTAGESLVIAGFERVDEGTGMQPRSYCQSWIMRPTFYDDLSAVELKWAAATTEVERLRTHIAALGVSTMKEKQS